jgi:hypothetical protein
MKNTTVGMALALAGVALVGCGPGNSVHGSVGGNSLAAVDAISLTYPVTSTETGAVVLVSDKGNLCQTLKAGHQPASWTLLELIVIKLDTATSTASLTPGTYAYVGQPTQPGSYSAGAFMKSDATCKATSSTTTTTAGTVTLTTANLAPSGRLTGSFDLTLGADKITGSFDAPFCDVSFSSSLQCQ